jgi:geranylgeranyl diphosphate synthase type II
MDAGQRIEKALSAAMSDLLDPSGPPLLAAAMRHSVFPGGARVRPRLSLAVATACGEDCPGLSEAAAAAIEILHCASLVHDDLPCFDDAPIRRGKPSVHRAFGEPLAVLSGDALIVLAFQTIARGGRQMPARIGHLVSIVGDAVGAPNGICAGQAWECEPHQRLTDYHRTKTGVLFAAATQAGAASCGHDPVPWCNLGLALGEAFQVADDIRDVYCTEEELGKPINRDEALGRPNATASLGFAGALLSLKQLIAQAVDSIPPCQGAAELRTLIIAQTNQFLPKELATKAA